MVAESLVNLLAVKFNLEARRNTKLFVSLVGIEGCQCCTVPSYTTKFGISGLGNLATSR
jgi:hypothetical protein